MASNLSIDLISAEKLHLRAVLLQACQWCGAMQLRIERRPAGSTVRTSCPEAFGPFNCNLFIVILL